MSESRAARQAIEAIASRLVAAWNRHDATAFAALYAEDADFTNVFGMSAHGRGQIEAFHAPIFRTMFRDSQLNATETRIRFIRPDVAAVDIRWEMTGARDPMGKEWPQRHGLLNLIATEAGGQWAITVLHNMDLPPPDRVKAIADLVQQP
jgi:uncharacterized protein (TIGR02246 family)